MGRGERTGFCGAVVGSFGLVYYCPGNIKWINIQSGRAAVLYRSKSNNKFLAFFYVIILSLL
jgi:hypothetical protein